MSKVAIKVSNLVKKYDGEAVVDDVSFEVKRGEAILEGLNVASQPCKFPNDVLVWRVFPDVFDARLAADSNKVYPADTCS